MRLIIKKFLFITFIASSSLIAQEKKKEVKYYHLFYCIHEHFLNSFSEHYGLFHLAAITGSYGMVQSGFDWEVHEFARKNQALARAGFPSVIAGGLLPLVLPLGLFAYSKIDNNDKILVTSLALGQSVMLSYFIVSGFKAITGRRGPDILDEENNPQPDYSKDFKFGFFERGVFDGWPSGHTTTAFAMAFTLVELFPENSTLSTLSLIYASLIGLGISVNIHWFSDFYAGSLIGYTIGNAVGKGFRSFFGYEEKDSNFIFSVMPGWISVQYRF